MSEEKSLQIEMDDATSQGAYINLAIISHSETEFVMDFVFFSPNPQKAKVRNRVITSPAHAKRFLAALQENISKYEARFGPVKVPTQPQEPRVGFFH